MDEPMFIEMMMTAHREAVKKELETAASKVKAIRDMMWSPGFLDTANGFLISNVDSLAKVLRDRSTHNPSSTGHSPLGGKGGSDNSTPNLQTLHRLYGETCEAALEGS